MSELSNIIQRRELMPLLLKAQKIVKHYEKASDYAACVIGPEFSAEPDCHPCRQCKLYTNQENGKKACFRTHMEAVIEARMLGGSYIYLCPASFIFWTSPFYSGERFAGALVSGGILDTDKDREKVKALAQMMLICADQITKGVHRIAGAAAGESYTDEENTESQAETAPQNYANPMDMERVLLASLRRGDIAQAKITLSELIKLQCSKARGNIQIFRLKAIELAVVLSRAVSESGKIEDDDMFDTNNRYLKKLEGCESMKEISDILLGMTEQMSGSIFSFHGVRHFSALRKAERFIWENYTKKISLKEIANVSGLSASYFSTIFREEMGENLSNYLNRLRVEKAASMLLSTNMSISEIAAACGFEDQSWFSKIFKNNTGITPGKYRELGYGGY